jgi:uncharacterized protein (UPF0333 family)
MAFKGIAISQIILLVLGIIVLSVVAYLLYSNFTSTTSQVDFQKCRAAVTNACTACSIAKGGNTQNCDAATYLTSNIDKQCAYNGLIPGVNANKNEKEEIIIEAEKTIPCDQYIGGSATKPTTITK